MSVGGVGGQITYAAMLSIKSLPTSTYRKKHLPWQPVTMDRMLAPAGSTSQALCARPSRVNVRALVMCIYSTQHYCRYSRYRALVCAFIL